MRNERQTSRTIGLWPATRLSGWKVGKSLSSGLSRSIDRKVGSDPGTEKGPVPGASLDAGTLVRATLRRCHTPDRQAISAVIRLGKLVTHWQGLSVLSITRQL